MIRNIIIGIITIMAFVSCFKKDEMIPPHEPGTVTTVVIPLTSYYTDQVYFNLQSEKITGISNRSSFDLNFECLDTSTIIRLNTANFAMAAVTEHEKLEAVTDTVGLDWKFDGSTGSLDSLAFSDWISLDNNDTNYNHKVYVVNRGISSLGINLGLIKIRFDSIANKTYHFSFSEFNSIDIHKVAIKKNNQYLYTQFSFEENAQKQIEPESSNWDLLFTQYTTLLYTNEGDPYPYLVTGSLQKYGLVKAALDTNLVFDEITITDTSLVDFSFDFDKIGYDWKELVGDVNTGDIRYEVKPNYNYIIRDDDFFYYKLRFVNFYNPETGEKGYPTFEFQQL